MKRIHYIGLLSFSLILFLAACASTPGKQQEEGQKSAGTTTLSDTFPKGTAIDKVLCLSDIKNSYSLYLPKAYNTKQNWPVVFFFDPHAQGRQPIQKYMGLAEKFGYIFIGSNNSENGQAIEAKEAIYNSLLADAKSRFAIDTRRIYTGGFSGGGRTAVSLAMNIGGINGVIGCGAGFPSLNKPIGNRFDYIGLVGDGDFNYQEMMNLDGALKNMNFPHQMLVFSGKHEWPPYNKMDDAFTWLQFNAMRSGLIDKHNGVIFTFVDDHKLVADSLLGKGKQYEAYMAYRQIIYFTEGLRDAKELILKTDSLANTNAVKDELIKIAKIRKAEEGMQAEYSAALSEKDLKWWKKTISALEQNAKTNKDTEEKGLSKRQLAAISMMSYTQVSGHLNNKSTDEAGRYLEIFKLSDPQNPDGPFLEACIHAARGEQSEAIAALQAAVKLKYSDIKKLQTEPLLEPIRKLPEFKAILEEAAK